jgi:hypothetical protein
VGGPEAAVTCIRNTRDTIPSGALTYWKAFCQRLDGS